MKDRWRTLTRIEIALLGGLVVASAAAAVMDAVSWLLRL